MEVNFRPLPPSIAARRAAPGQVPSSDEGQNFMEIVENLTGAENNPEGNEQAGKKEQAGRQRQALQPKPSGMEPAEKPPADGPPPVELEERRERKIGAHFDMLA